MLAARRVLSFDALTSCQPVAFLSDAPRPRSEFAPRVGAGMLAYASSLKRSPFNFERFDSCAQKVCSCRNCAEAARVQISQ